MPPMGAPASEWKRAGVSAWEVVFFLGLEDPLSSEDFFLDLDELSAGFFGLGFEDSPLPVFFFGASPPPEVFFFGFGESPSSLVFFFGLGFGESLSPPVFFLGFGESLLLLEVFFFDAAEDEPPDLDLVEDDSFSFVFETVV